MEGAKTWSFHSEVLLLFANQEPINTCPMETGLELQSTSGSNVLCVVSEQRSCFFPDNLQRRGNQLVNRCYLCAKEEKSSNHYFLHCSFTL